MVQFWFDPRDRKHSCSTPPSARWCRTTQRRRERDRQPWDVLPVVTSQDPTDVGDAHAIASGELPIGVTRGPQAQELLNVRLPELGVVVLAPSSLLGRHSRQRLASGATGQRRGGFSRSRPSGMSLRANGRPWLSAAINRNSLMRRVRRGSIEDAGAVAVRSHRRRANLVLPRRR
jgi:hypothetical protein